MKRTEVEKVKKLFEDELRSLLIEIEKSVSTDNQWNIKGFIDIHKTIFSSSTDTKIISKVMEIQMYPILKEFAEKKGYELVLPSKQNWYPDMTFILKENAEVKFAVDFKTTYRDQKRSEFCNGFTLGSHGGYFCKRNSKKNIQFPYEQYKAHYCLGVIYSRMPKTDEKEKYNLDELLSIPSTIGEFTFFLQEKWKIASDKPGSGNTANIGSISYIPDIIKGQGMFAKLGEKVFDDYWINYGKIEVLHEDDGEQKTKKLTSLDEYVIYRGMNSDKIIKKKKRKEVK